MRHAQFSRDAQRALNVKPGPSLTQTTILVQRNFRLRVRWLAAKGDARRLPSLPIHARLVNEETNSCGSHAEEGSRQRR
jgi:hypothetical protein